MEQTLYQLLNKKGFDRLLPIQKKFLEWWKRENRKDNLIVSAPTTSGKTLIAEAMIEYYSRQDTEPLLIVFICPLKSLINEKCEEFQKSLEVVTIETEINQYTPEGKKLLLTTPEKFFEMIKQKPEILKLISLIVVDEIHLISDKHRGLIVDFLLTCIKDLLPETHFLLMSATISYRDKLANWINADCIIDDKRAVPLSIEVRKISKPEDIVNLALSEVKKNKSVLIFRGTKRWVHTTVKRILEHYQDTITDPQLDNQLRYGKKTRSDKSIESYLKLGVGMHHADIRDEIKKATEWAFRHKKIKILVCTTTLGLGVNLPADTVIVADTRLGRDNLSPTIFFQLAGRSGRLGFSSKGKTYLCVRNENDKQNWEKIITSPIISDAPISISLLISEGSSSLVDVELYLLRVISTEFFDSWDQIINHHLNSFSNYYHTSKLKSKIFSSSKIYRGLGSRITKSRDLPTFIKERGKIFEKEHIAEKNEVIRLTLIGEECLKNNIEPSGMTELIKWVLQPKNDLSLFEVILKAIKLFPELYVSPDPDQKTLYNQETISAFKQIGKDVFAYLESFNRSKTNVTTDLTFLAMIFAAFDSLNFEEVCDRFGVLYKSFERAVNKLSNILFSLGKILSQYYKKQEFGDLITQYAWQIKYCVTEDKIELVKVLGIGKERAEQVMKKYTNIKNVKLDPEEIKKELMTINGIGEILAQKLVEVLESNIKIQAQKKQSFSEVLNKVLELLKEGETEVLELKERFNFKDKNHKNKFVRTVCGMANNKGGYIVYGINDKGDIVGCERDSYKIEEFDNIISSRINPKFNNYEIYQGPHMGKNILIFQINADHNGPYYVDKTIYFRRKGRNEPIRYDEYQNLKRKT